MPTDSEWHHWVCGGGRLLAAGATVLPVKGYSQHFLEPLYPTEDDTKTLNYDNTTAVYDGMISYLNLSVMCTEHFCLTGPSTALKQERNVDPPSGNLKPSLN